MRRHAAAIALLAGATAAQTTLLVPQQFATVAAAVAAANEGDTILVGSGLWGVDGVRIDKGVNIIGNGNGTTFYGGGFPTPLTITMAAGKRCVLAGIALGSGPFYCRLRFENSRGSITVADCPTGTGTLMVDQCDQVLLTRWTMNGISYALAPTITASASTLVVAGCSFRGATDNPEFSYPSQPAAFVHASAVRCVDTAFAGGDGTPWGGPGSHAIVSANSEIRMTGPLSSAVAGARTTLPAIVLNAGSLTLEPGFNPTMALTGAQLLRETRPSILATVTSQSIGLTLRSPAGTLGAVLVGYPSRRATCPGITGEAWLDPATMCIATLGVQQGSLGWSTNLPRGVATPLEFRWQGIVLQSGVLTLTDASALLVR